MRIKIILLSIIISGNLLSQENAWVKNIRESKTINVNAVEDLYNQSNKTFFKHYERWKWINRLDIDESGNLNTEKTIYKEYYDRQSYNKSANATAGNWSPLGPDDWTNGNTGYNPGIGRINAITVDPTNDDIIYACAASGGLWKSNDAGQMWNALTDDFLVLGTSDLAVNPNNNQILYLATGDRDGLDTYGIGVFKSTDGGASWNPTGLYNDEPMQSFIINCLEINPENPNIIYAGSKSGLYRTEDAGDNWEKVIPFGDFNDVKLNPENPNTVFAAKEDRFYRSTDGGLNFEIIYELPTLNVGRITFDVTPADTSYIYVLIADFSNNFMGVYRSTDGGTSFEETVNGDNINLLGYASDGQDDGSQAWYDLAIAASPTNKNKVYTGGINVWTSSDGGVNWNITSEWYYTGNNSKYSHADIHSLDFYGNTLYCGSDGGAFKNENENGWQNISSGLNISQIYKFSNSTDGTRVSIGTQDNGTNILNPYWKHIRGADGMSTIIDYNNPNNVYCSIYYASIYKSTTGGDNNYNIFSADSYGEGAGWVSPLVIDKINNAVLYVGAENIYKTSNYGSSWSAITDFDNANYFTFIAVAPSNPDYIYASRDDMFIRTKNGGNSWEELNLPIGGTVTGIEISSNDPEKIFVSSSGSSVGYVASSIDAGDNFESDYPNIYTGVYAIAYENNEENGIYAATSYGVLYINDNLTEWVDYINNMPFVKVTDLEIVNSINKLRAATYGRGVWESALYAQTVNVDNSITEKVLNIYPNPVEDILTLDFSDYKISKLVVYNVSGIMVYKTENISNSINIDVSNYIEGSYFIKVLTNENKEIIKKFVKK